MRRLCGILLAILCGLGFVMPVSAATDADIVMSLRPSEQELELQAGQHYEGLVVVYNIGKVPFEFDVSAAPYQVKNDNYEQDFVTESMSTQLANWVSLPETHFAVNPNQYAEVRFAVDVPEEAPGGGQYAALIIRTSDEQQNSAGINVIGQIAALLYGHIACDDVRATGELKEYDFPSLMLKDEFKIKSVIENTGNVDFKVAETLEITNFFTQQKVITPESVNSAGYAVGSTTATVLPGTARAFTMSWNDAPQLGLFRVKHIISYLGEDHVTEKVVLICPLWVIVLVSIMLVLALVWLAASLAEHRKEKPQVF